MKPDEIETWLDQQCAETLTQLLEQAAREDPDCADVEARAEVIRAMVQAGREEMCRRATAIFHDMGLPAPPLDPNGGLSLALPKGNA